MAPPKSKQRQTMVWAAAKLFRRQGYSGTGLRDILAASGAARGSLYHHFPGGKEEIGAAAVTAAGSLVTETFQELANLSDSPADFLRHYTDLLVRWLALISSADRSNSAKSRCKIIIKELESVFLFVSKFTQRNVLYI